MSDNNNIHVTVTDTEVRIVRTPEGDFVNVIPPPTAQVEVNMINGVVVAIGAQTIEGETPAGILDGSNATFTSAFPFLPSSVEVHVNGLLQKPIVHYITMGAQTIVLADSPQIGDQILINYKKA